MSQLLLVAESAFPWSPMDVGLTAFVLFFSFYVIRLLAKVVEGYIRQSKGLDGALDSGAHRAIKELSKQNKELSKQVERICNGGLSREDRQALRRMAPVLESIDQHLYSSDSLQRELIEELRRNREAEAENTKRWIKAYADIEGVYKGLELMIARGIVCKYGETVIGGD